MPNFVLIVTTTCFCFLKLCLGQILDSPALAWFEVLEPMFDLFNVGFSSYQGKNTCEFI
jgi:hypothetical protein